MLIDKKNFIKSKFLVSYLLTKKALKIVNKKTGKRRYKL